MHLHDQLASYFGSDNVFIDVAGIEPGADFVNVLEQTLSTSDAVLAVIGPHWLTARTPDGSRRIDESDDYLRREILAAIDHGRRLIPVLVSQAAMPTPAELPASIAELSRRNAIALRDAHWHSDMDGLLRTLQTMMLDTKARGPMWWLHASNWPSLTLDWIFSFLAILLVAAGYFDSWINRHISGLPWEHLPVHIAWLLVVLCLATAMTIRWRRTRRADLIIPKGYTVSVIGCVVFACGIFIGSWWSVAAGPEVTGLPAAFRPPNLLLIAGGVLIVIGPLRAAVSRRELVAGPTALISATLLLASVTFFSQIIHPYVNAWAYDRHQLPTQYDFVGEELGSLSLFIQAAVVCGTVLFTLRQIRLPPGSLTLMLTATAFFVASQFGHFEYVGVALAVGLLADVLLAWAGLEPNRMPQLRVFAAGLGTLLAAIYLLVIWLAKGIYWRPDIIFGSIVVCGMIGWLLSYLTFPDRQMTAAAAVLWKPDGPRAG